jgi:hypothetical protein
MFSKWRTLVLFSLFAIAVFYAVQSQYALTALFGVLGLYQIVRLIYTRRERREYRTSLRNAIIGTIVVGVGAVTWGLLLVFSVFTVNSAMGWRVAGGALALSGLYFLWVAERLLRHYRQP